MRLTADTLDRFKSGRFEDFLDDGAIQLRRTFPKRFIPFSDEDTAHDAGRNVVGLSYERACEMGRRSGLLAMRIAFLRAAYGIGVLDDPRYPSVRAMVEAQVAAASIKPNTSIGTFLTETRPHWDAAPFARGGDRLADLVESLDTATQDWSAILSFLQITHQEAGSDVGEESLRQFVNKAYSDAAVLGIASLEGLQLHVLVADGLGLHFFDDPFLPDWGKIYRTGSEGQIIKALRSALVSKER